MQEFKGISGSTDLLEAMYLNRGVEPGLAKAAAVIVIRERAGNTRDRTLPEKNTMHLVELQMRKEKLRSQLELIKKGIQALEEVREAHKLKRSPHPVFGTPEHAAKRIRID